MALLQFCNTAQFPGTSWNHFLVNKNPIIYCGWPSSFTLYLYSSLRQQQLFKSNHIVSMETIISIGFRLVLQTLNNNDKAHCWNRTNTPPPPCKRLKAIPYRKSVSWELGLESSDLIFEWADEQLGMGQGESWKDVGATLPLR